MGGVTNGRKPAGEKQLGERAEDQTRREEASYREAYNDYIQRAQAKGACHYRVVNDKDIAPSYLWRPMGGQHTGTLVWMDEGRVIVAPQLQNNNHANSIDNSIARQVPTCVAFEILTNHRPLHD
jgi:hypothetical protein